MSRAKSEIRGILLDIEGTTSSISFVHDVMFPFVLTHLESFLSEHFQRTDVCAACDQIAKDAGHESLAQWAVTSSADDAVSLITQEVRKLMSEDVKATGLKHLQGLIWQGGFVSAELKAHVYPDVIPAINRWRSAGIDIRIYSSGSIAAQKLFFKNLAQEGNCLHLFSGHYDTTSGGKKESDSYRRIATDWGLEPAKILFISDIEDELSAARDAGMHACVSIRPGNAPIDGSRGFPAIQSFSEVEV